MRLQVLLVIVFVICGDLALGQRRALDSEQTGVAGSTTQIKGSVRDENGLPISGVRIVKRGPITYVTGPLGRHVTAIPATISSAQSALDGSFEFSTQEVGEHDLCIRTATDILLDVCAWSGLIGVRTNGEAVVTLNPVTMPAAAIVRVHVSDPYKAILVPVSPLQAPSLILGLRKDRAFVVLRDAGTDTSGFRLFVGSAPIGVPLTLWLDSGVVDLTDSVGRAVPKNGGNIPLVIGRSASPSIDLSFSALPIPKPSGMITLPATPPFNPCANNACVNAKPIP